MKIYLTGQIIMPDEYPAVAVSYPAALRADTFYDIVD